MSKHKRYKLCPECGGRLQKTEIKTEKSGVIYFENGLQCIECGNFEKTSRNRRDQDSEEE
jgi:uncharacterized protein with PIN domain